MYSYLFPAARYSVPSGVTPTDVRNTAESMMGPLEARLQHLELACAGLWELLKTQHGYTDEQLIASIQAVDARDGSVDGKVAHAAQSCPHCHRKLLTRNSARCSWCGGDLIATPL